MIKFDLTVGNVTILSVRMFEQAEAVSDTEMSTEEFVALLSDREYTEEPDLNTSGHVGFHANIPMTTRPYYTEGADTDV